MRDLVSVLVPIYNSELYLRCCLDSIINQSHRNIEILLFVDGSRDKSIDICNEYAKSDTRIIVVDSNNVGVSSARNYCLDICRGDYVFFVDSDDWISIDAIELLLANLIKNDADISVGDFRRTCNEDAERPIRNGNDSVFSNIEALRQMSGVYGVRLVSPCMKIYKKFLFDSVRYPAGRYHEDDATTYRVIFNAKRVSIINSVVYYYRVTPGSIVETPSIIKKLDALVSAYERYLFYQEMGDIALLSQGARSLLHKYISLDMLIHNKLACSGNAPECPIRASFVIGCIRSTRHPITLKLLAEIYFYFPLVGRLLMRHVVYPHYLSKKYSAAGM